MNQQEQQVLPFLVAYNEYVQQVIKSGKVNVDKLCNGYVVKNIGNTICTINLDPLQPGESRSMGGNFLEIYVGRIDIAFGAQVINLSGPPVNSAIVTQKFYNIQTKLEQL